MHYFRFPVSFILIGVVAVAAENLFADWEDTPDVLSQFDEGWALTNPLASTDSYTAPDLFPSPDSLSSSLLAQDASGGIALASSDSNNLGFDLPKDKEVDTDLTVSAFAKCSSPIEKKRLRRGGEAFCANNDETPLSFPAYDTYKGIETITTDYDKAKCPSPSFKNTPLYVCSSKLPSKTIYLSGILSWALLESTRSKPSAFLVASF